MLLQKLSIALLLFNLPGLSGKSEVLEIHGSGTTNPSKCFWLLMTQMMDKSKVPIRMTYRAVGSGTGIDEFVGGNNGYKPYNDFGSGDIPIPTDDYTVLKDNGVGVLHLPIFLGAISVFHSIENLGTGQLNVTACVLAKIFNRDIKYWDDEAILENNPELSVPYANYPINVARRVKGSSSTASLTKYLHEACPTIWKEDMVGSTIEWPADTMECDGSGPMTSCILENPGTIGYIDAGHGHAYDLTEIELENKDGYFLSSKVAAENGGIADAAADTPDRADEDFGAIHLLNKPGRYTWPMVAMTYAYVRKDLSFLADDQEKTLLLYFLKSLYDPETITQCEVFGFVLVPDSIKRKSLAALAEIDVGSGTEWIYEDATLVGEGMGDYVISSKRRSYTEVQVSQNTADIGDMEAESPSSLRAGAMTTAGTPGTASSTAQTALILGAVSIALWCVTIVFVVAKVVLKL